MMNEDWFQYHFGKQDDTMSGVLDDTKQDKLEYMVKDDMYKSQDNEATVDDTEEGVF
jgi:hypothetical protein